MNKYTVGNDALAHITEEGRPHLLVEHLRGFLLSARDENSAQLFTKPKEGKRYSVGVTTLEKEAIGDYSVKLVNNGRLDAVAANS